jgi:hypothetical protein
MRNILLWKLKKEEKEVEKGALATFTLSAIWFISLLLGLIAYNVCIVMQTNWYISIVYGAIATILIFVILYFIAKSMQDEKDDTKDTT